VGERCPTRAATILDGASIALKPQRLAAYSSPHFHFRLVGNGAIASRPCVDGSPVSRGFDAFIQNRWCGHVSGLFMLRYSASNCRLATGPDEVRVSKANQRDAINSRLALKRFLPISGYTPFGYSSSSPWHFCCPVCFLCRKPEFRVYLRRHHNSTRSVDNMRCFIAFALREDCPRDACHFIGQGHGC